MMVDCLNCKHNYDKGYNKLCSNPNRGAGFWCEDFELGLRMSAITGIATGVGKFLNWR